MPVLQKHRLNSFTNMENLTQRIQLLLEALNERVFGKEHIISLSLLSAVAGESIFLLGPPGVAKSMVARRLKLAFRNAGSFDYLMSRFSTPDEIFGPVSISKLKDRDTYERMTEGYLPTATIAFLDEIWKAGPAIQNALLTILNEKIYRNGNHTFRVPLKGLVAASNELPASGQGLDALWDRFLVRMLVTGITDQSDFDRMIASPDESEPCVNTALQIEEQEYKTWQGKIGSISIHYSIFEVIHTLKEKIEDHNHKLQNAESTEQPLYVSDRRWKKLVKLLRTSAFLNGSDTIRLTDCLLLRHCLWNEVSQLEEINEMVTDAIRMSAEGYLLNLQGLHREMEALKDELSSAAAVHENRDPGLLLVDSYYHQIDKVRLAGRLLMFASDYQSLDTIGKLFYLHKDKYKSQCFILKRYDLSMRNKVPQHKIYSLRKGNRSVFINDYEYPLVCVPGCEPLPPQAAGTDKEKLEERFCQLNDLLLRVEGGCKDFYTQEWAYADRHLFLNEQERDIIRGLLEHQQTSVADYRNELNELEHAYREENTEYPSESIEGNLFG